MDIMRKSSALFDRLDKRFARMENVGASPFRGYERLDRFVRDFEDRIKKLESMGKFREMGLFKRMPTFSAKDPWGSMGGWHFAKDFVYLDWEPEQEEQVEEVVASKVSPWGTADKADGNKDLRVNSPWLNTPFTPARVSQGRVQGVKSSARKGRSLQHLAAKVAVSEHYSSTQKQVKESLPPMLSGSSNLVHRLMGEDKRQEKVENSVSPLRKRRKAKKFSPKESSRKRVAFKKNAVKKTNTSSLLNSSQNRLQSDMPSIDDYQILVQELLQEIETIKLGSPVSTPELEKKIHSIKKRIQKSGASKPLQSIIERRVQSLSSKSVFGRESVLPSSFTNAKSSKKQDGGFYQEKEEIVLGLVKKIEELSSTGTVSNAQSSKAIKQYVQVADRKIRKLQSRSKMKISSPRLFETMFSSLPLDSSEESLEAQKTSLTERIAKNGELPKLFQREAFIEKKIVTELVRKIDGVRSSKNLSEDKLAESIEKHVQIAEQKIRKLQSTRKMKNSSPDLVSAVLSSLPSDLVEEFQVSDVESAVSPWFTKEESRPSNSSLADRIGKFIENTQSKAPHQAARRSQIVELVERLERSQEVSERSVLPKLFQREAFVEKKIVTELVQKIERLRNVKTLSEGQLSETIEQHVRIAERKIKKLQSGRRNRKSSIDLVDLQSASEESSEAGFPQMEANQAEIKTASPWFSHKIVEKKEVQNLSATQQAASRMLRENPSNPTRPEIIAKSFGLSKQEAKQVVSEIQAGNHSQTSSDSQGLRNAEKEDQSKNRFSHPSLLSYVDKREKRAELSDNKQTKISSFEAKKENPLLGAWDRATAPMYLPEWRSIGTEGRNPLSSGRSWRLNTQKRAMYPNSALEETFLNPGNLSSEESADQIEATKNGSPWFSNNKISATNDFEAAELKGIPNIASMGRLQSQAKKFGSARSVQLTVDSIQRKSATWLEPNRTVLLSDGVVIDAKQAKMMGIKPQKRSAGNLPLQWTLEALQLESNNSALPAWAKRASGKSQYTSKAQSVDQEFVSQIAKSSNLEDVVEAILDRSKTEFVGNATLAKSTVQAIERIRNESHRALETKLVAGAEKRIGTKKRQSAKHSSLSFTGLKPLSVGQTAQRERKDDKISKLAQKLENLVLLAEDNRRDEARQGVRMAEDSHSAVAEGKSAGETQQSRDHSIDIDALAQEVLFAFEQEVALRKISSFDESSNTDVWW